MASSETNAFKSVLLKNQADPESNKKKMKIQMTRNEAPVDVIAMEDEFLPLH